MGIINLGILAHVDAGKTSLTERILFETGVIGAIGRVDHGDTQTDTLDLERQRGITIQSTVVSFPLNGHKVNLIDTPGHADFIAEVERSLLALDGVVLVVSAVEGIQPQTRRLVRVVRSLGLPVILFINKIDRVGARTGALVAEIRDQLGLPVVTMADGRDVGTRAASVVARRSGCPDDDDAVVETLAAQSTAFLDEYVRRDGNLSTRQISRETTRQARRGNVVPAYVGSAVTGAGVDLLLGGITRYLPLAAKPFDADRPLSATVFRIQRLPSGEKIAFVRLDAGRIARRDRVTLSRRSGAGLPQTDEERVTGVDRFEDGSTRPADSVVAGDIARLHGLRSCRIGDVLGAEPPRNRVARFNRPTLESVVRPERSEQVGRLALALQHLAEQDPLIELRRDTARSELSVRLYGEVQKEVITATLADQFGLDVSFAPSQVVCIEVPIGEGWAVEHIGATDNPFLATVGLRVEPGEPGSGITFRRPSGALDLSFYRAVEETVHETLTEGLRGWGVTDCRVSLTDTAMAPTSVAMDYRRLTPLVLMAALRQAGTCVREPVQRFELTCPEWGLGEVLPALTAAHATPEDVRTSDRQTLITGTVPSAAVHRLEQRLPGLAGGEATFVSDHAGYQGVVGEPPCRPRTDLNPLNRKQYIALVSQL